MLVKSEVSGSGEKSRGGGDSHGFMLFKLMIPGRSFLTYDRSEPSALNMADSFMSMEYPTVVPKI